MKLLLMYKNGQILSISQWIFKLFRKNYTYMIEIENKLIKQEWNDWLGQPNKIKSINYIYSEPLQDFSPFEYPSEIAPYESRN